MILTNMAHCIARRARAARAWLHAAAGAAGVVGDDSGAFRHVVGLSLFWDTPIGPLRFNFSKALKKESFDREQTFNVSIRSQF